MTDLNKRIIIETEDGGCKIMIPSPEFIGNGGKITDLVEAGIPHKIIDKSDIPTDRLFRKAWVYDSNSKKIREDIDRAKPVHLDKIREERSQEFINMGFPHVLNPALEGTIMTSDMDKLQALRDAPQNVDIELISTMEELKASWPEKILKKNPYKDKN